MGMLSWFTRGLYGGALTLGFGYSSLRPESGLLLCVLPEVLLAGASSRAIRATVLAEIPVAAATSR